MDTDLLALLLSASFLEDIQIRAILYQACAEGHHDTSAVHVMPMEHVYPCIHAHTSATSSPVFAWYVRSISLSHCLAGPSPSMSALGVSSDHVVVLLEGITQFTVCCCSSLVALVRPISRADAVWVAVPALVQHHAPRPEASQHPPQCGLHPPAV